MTDVHVQLLPELSGPGRLGRHVEHDRRSRLFEHESKVRKPRSVLWTRRTPIWDQLDTGSSTGQAVAGCLVTDHAGGQGRDDLTEDTALTLYEGATRLDNIPGHYPPDDTGSSGLAACKAAKKAGLIDAYRWALSTAGLINALQTGPAAIGISWLRGCDRPGAGGLIQYSGPSRGGHEVCVIGVNLESGRFRLANSWGAGWGDGGFFDMTINDMTKALRDSGDVAIPEVA